MCLRVTWPNPGNQNRFQLSVDPVNDSDAIARVLWELTDRGYKRASPAFLNVKTNTAVRAEEEDKSPDFSKESAQPHLHPWPALPRAGVA